MVESDNGFGGVLITAGWVFMWERMKVGPNNSTRFFSRAILPLFRKRRYFSTTISDKERRQKDKGLLVGEETFAFWWLIRSRRTQQVAAEGRVAD